LKDTFDGVAVALWFVAEVHAEVGQAGIQPGDAIDEESGAVGGVCYSDLVKPSLSIT